MAHDLETFRNGDAAFYSARVPAWHRLGTVTEKALTIPEALQVSHLAGWDITKQPLVTLGHDGQAIEVPNRYATVRRNPDPDLHGQSDVLGVVGEDYTVVSNEDAFAFLGQLVDDGDVTIETAGSLRGGKRVFVTMKVPSHISVADGDDLDLYVAVATGHDGVFAFHAFPTPVRVVCQNTLSMAMAGMDRSYRMVHTDGVGLRIAEAREALRVTFQEGETLGSAAREMINTKISNDLFDRLIADNFVPVPYDPTPLKITRMEEKRDDLRTLFRTAPTQEIGRGTAWGAFNAIAEWTEYVRPREAQSERATESVLMGPIAQTRQKAWGLLAPAWAAQLTKV